MIVVQPSAYERALARVRQLPINTLFVQSVLRRHVDGQVFADDERAPGAFYAIHPYGMSLLWGESDRPPWLAWLRRHLRATPRPATEWLQVYPERWVSIVAPGFAGLRQTRVNFAFDRDAYLRGRAQIAAALAQATIRPTTAEEVAQLDGSVVPKWFWRDGAQFVAQGGGFSLVVDGMHAAIAFCSYRHDAQLEIGIETAPELRGRGYARLVASALIDDCLRKNLEPVWACRLENAGSYRLALALGFVPTLRLPYFRLP